MKWYLKCLYQYATFSGRARRKEFWMFVLFYYIFLYLTIIVDTFATRILHLNPLIITENFSNGYINLFYALASIVPGFAVTVRRLHDTGKSGASILIALIPFGVFWLLIVLCTDSATEVNRYGINPKTVEAEFATDSNTLDDDLRL